MLRISRLRQEVRRLLMGGGGPAAKETIGSGGFLAGIKGETKSRGATGCPGRASRGSPRLLKEGSCLAIV